MKKALLALFQLSLTAALLWWVFHDPAKRQVLFDAIRQADRRWLAAAIGMYGVFEILAGVRWQLLLRVQGVHISWSRLYGLVMVGLFFSLFIPGGTGGDIIKGYYLLKEAPVGRKTSAAFSIVMDRLLGMVGIAILAGSITAYRWQWLTSDPVTASCVYTGLLVLGASMGGMIIAGVISGLRLVHALPEHLPGRGFLATLSGAYAVYGQAWLPTGAAIILSVLAHTAHYTTFWFSIKAMEWSGPRKPNAIELYSALPIIEVVAALPITPGGLGTREKLFDEMLTPLAKLDEGIAPAVSIIGYLCIAFWGVVGGILYVFYRPGRLQREAILAETEAQLTGTRLG